ncbi:MAG: hypothetical protein H0W64_06175 [Gammaproteobacteria bacterium]|nr:hypothetical protein [Gammaproteobacteria bacterium]
MRRFFSQLIPFIFIGVALVALAFGIFLLAYLFFIGAIVGFVLFSLAWLKQKFFPPKAVVKLKSPRPPRTIDSDDWKEL